MGFTDDPASMDPPSVSKKTTGVGVGLGVGVGVVVGIVVKIGVGVTVGVALGADYFKSLSHTTANVVVSDDFLLVGSSQISPVMMNSSPSTAFEGTSAW